jgi:putative transposase
MSGRAVAETLDQVVARHGQPATVSVDHGTGLISRATNECAYPRGVKLDLIHLGKPVENGLIQAFNGRLRDECLNPNWFLSFGDSTRKFEGWLEAYNHHRPRSSLGELTPSEFLRHGQRRTDEAADFYRPSTPRQDPSRCRTFLQPASGGYPAADVTN